EERRGQVEAVEAGDELVSRQCTAVSKHRTGQAFRAKVAMNDVVRLRPAQEIRSAQKRERCCLAAVAQEVETGQRATRGFGKPASQQANCSARAGNKSF